MSHRLRDILDQFPFIQKRLKKRAMLLLNPISGEGKARKTFRYLRRYLRTVLENYHVDISFSRRPGDLSVCAKEAIENNYDLVIICGGDGAINETIQGMVGSSVPLGIIPRGTANIFAEEMGIPKSIEKALRVIKAGYTKRIDLGLAKDRYFLWLSGIGIDALVAQEVHLDSKDQFGIFAYLAFALKHLRSIPSSKIRIKTGDREIREQATALIIGNTASYDGKLKIRARERLDDGYFDVCLVRKLSFLFIVRAILFFLLGRRAYYRDVKYLDLHYFKAKELTIESDPPVYIHVDGEVLGKTPAHFRVIPQALSIILPQPGKAT